MTVEIRPRWNHCDESEGCTSQTDLEGRSDILLYKADNESESLFIKVKSELVVNPGEKRTPKKINETVVMSSASFWPSKS
jgi:hypothetical protein